MATAVLWILLGAATGAFCAQMAVRARLFLAAPGPLRVDRPGIRLKRLLLDVVGQRRTIRERPAVGVAHALVFWGFLAFAGYTAAEFADGLGLLHVTRTRWFTAYRMGLTPIAILVLAGILFLIARRVLIRPIELGTTVSRESVVIGAFIVILMTTFLLAWPLDPGSVAGRVNWWLHAGVVLGFLGLIPASKHLHLLLSPFAVFLRSPELGALANLDFDKGEVGLETTRDVGRKTVLDAFACVECGRCQVNCPAWGAGQALNPKTVILQTREALLAGRRDTPLSAVYSPEVLWQCTTCGACEQQCPVGVEHMPLLVGARRGLVSNGEAPAYLGGLYGHLERRSNIWGLGYDERRKFVEAEQLETFDPRRHDILVWLGCAGAFESDFQASLRSLFAILRTAGVRFGVLAKETCTGDVARRTGNEFLFQELAQANIEQLKTSGVGTKTILTSCPHCAKTIGADYARFGCDFRVEHSAVFVEALTRDLGVRETTEGVTYHDPCYLGRYEQRVDEPRALLARVGARVHEPVRHGDNPYCCGAGGGLLFADKESAPGTRISDVRLGQLEDTGASTIVTACPFCSIMLKGAQASRPPSPLRVVDLMTYVSGRLEGLEGREGREGRERRDG
jgi:Fe-S oxidoreductase